MMGESGVYIVRHNKQNCTIVHTCGTFYNANIFSRTLLFVERLSDGRFWPVVAWLVFEWGLILTAEGIR